MTKARAKKRPHVTSGSHKGRAASAAKPSTKSPPSRPAIRFLPAILGVALAAFGLLGLGPDGSRFLWSILTVAAVLIGWNAQLLTAPAYRARGLTVNVELRPQHYMQVFVQSTIFLYWGLQLPFPLVRDHLPLLLVQIAFAYGFDLLLSWTRRGRYTLGFGPCPVILSINLFLWFKPEWFFLQFVIVAVGFAAKDMIRWTREGRRVHIFNPSSFPLAVASVALILTHNTSLTYGELIANSQNLPPHMYLLLFTIALPGQLLFGVASMSLAAGLTMYLFGLLYFAATGTYFFLDAFIPISVFLGMLLLVTDPSTAPRTELGRLVFGGLYGASTVVLYWILLSLGVPAFYDKLLQIPLLNLSVRGLDRMASSPRVAMINPERLGRALKPRRRYLVYASVWATLFVVMSTTRAVGDRHPGQWLPFWIKSCEQGRSRACAYVAVVEHNLCERGSGWACNEAAILGPRSSWGLETHMDAAQRTASFRAGCDHGFMPACKNVVRAGQNDAAFERSPPTLADYPLVLRGSRTWMIPPSTPAELYARACAQGWPGSCDQVAPPTPTPPPTLPPK